MSFDIEGCLKTTGNSGRLLNAFLQLFLVSHLLANRANGQSVYERIPNNADKGCVLLLAYRGDQIKGFGSASLFYAPLATNSDAAYVVCAVTALHNLKEKDTGSTYDGIYLKINMPVESKPRYVKVPLRTDSPKNYWTSPTGLDLAVIPLPPEVVNGAVSATFKEDAIVTPAMHTNLDVSPGLIVQVMCLQPEYWSYPTDYLQPQTIPTMRMGHLSRLGFQKSSTGTQVRPHVIDVHSSPGNSGASVLVWVPLEVGHVSQPMFLGIVQGFYEEIDSYKEYKIPLTSSSSNTAVLELVSAQTGSTNKFILAFRTLANPNLSEVIPVHEIVGLRDSPEFQAAAAFLAQNHSQYEFFSALPAGGKVAK